MASSALPCSRAEVAWRARLSKSDDGLPRALIWLKSDCGNAIVRTSATSAKNSPRRLEGDLLLTVKSVGDTLADVSMHAFYNEFTTEAQRTQRGIATTKVEAFLFSLLYCWMRRWNEQRLGLSSSTRSHDSSVQNLTLTALPNAAHPRWLDPLIRKHSCAILLIRYNTKARTGRAIYRGQGNIDFSGAVCTEMMTRMSNRTLGR